MSTRHTLRIVVIAPLRFPIRPPHAGGLEAAVWAEIDMLRRRGHDVTVIGPTGSDFVDEAGAFALPALTWPAGADGRDGEWPVSYEGVVAPALERALEEVVRQADRYDVISNHCLHPLPLRRAPQLRAFGLPMVTTLHTPVDAAFVSAHRSAAGEGSLFLSVSDHIRREWAAAGVPSTVLPNGVDTAAWPQGPGGADIVWFGRLVPEKAPHVAIAVARRLGRHLTIAGRVGNRGYVEEVVAPLLDDDVTLAGVLGPASLARLVGHSGLALATPAWAEPFGLVAPEALLCGTPVVGFAVGGVPEIATGTLGMRLVAAGDVDGMVAEARGLLAHSGDPAFRRAVRAGAVDRFSLAARITRLEDIFGELAARGARQDGISA